MRVEFSSAAAKSLRKLRDQKVRQRLVQAAESLAADPRPHGCKKLANSGGAYRIRVGDWRLVYEIKDDVLLVLVLRIGHRQEIYER